MKKVFIDGKAGTTGLRIYERLGQRDDIELLTLAEEDRKNAEKRKAALNNADIAFLCLPDDAAVDAVRMIENPNAVVIDTSTAHRTANGWVYGFPELGKDFSDRLKSAKRIAVPGPDREAYGSFWKSWVWAFPAVRPNPAGRFAPLTHPDRQLPQCCGGQCSRKGTAP